MREKDIGESVILYWSCLRGAARIGAAFIWTK